MRTLLCSFITIIATFLTPSYAQDVPSRPPIWGIAKMTFLISDFELARDYYGRFLCFDEVFSYPSDSGKVLSFKINDRQFLEFIEDRDAFRKNRLSSVSFETDDVQKMEDYLLSKNIIIAKETHTDGAGNNVLLVYDPSGVPVEFVEYGEQSLHMQSRGKSLSSGRIATRLHHAGLYSDNMEDAPVFYTQILDFKRVLRVPEDMVKDAQILYFRLPESAEMIEHYSTKDKNFSHPCFVTMDIQETYSTLRKREKTEVLAIPSIGLGKRWLLNITNKDGTKVEFTEPYISVF
jgi:catechol 2,3-dioxygenase-like lactoylglutathione lyase family enzyme